MGPTGTPTEIEPGETVVLVGGGLGNAVLFSIGQAFRAAGSKVLYFAGYKKMQDRYKVADIEAAADVVVWCSDEAPGFAAQRPQDRAFVGNIVQAMRAYASGGWANRPSVQRMRPHHRHRFGQDDGRGRRRAPLGPGAVPQARAPRHRLDQLADAMHVERDLCAMPAAAARSVTGKVTYVFSCFNQDQPLDLVDFPGLDLVKQNALQEKVTARWIEHVTAGSG
jgi:hypothetical protein